MDKFNNRSLSDFDTSVVTDLKDIIFCFAIEDCWTLNCCPGDALVTEQGTSSLGGGHLRRTSGNDTGLVSKLLLSSHLELNLT